MLLCEPPPPVVPSGVDAPVRTRSLPEAVDCDPEWVVRKWVCAGNSAVTSTVGFGAHLPGEVA